MAMGATPSVEGARERIRAVTTATQYSAGAVLGAATYALALSLITGALGIREYALYAATAVALVFVVPALLGRRLPIPQRIWQVPQSWFGRSRAQTAFAHFSAGVVLGLGVFTPIRYATFFVWSALAGALPPTRALLVSLVYGVARTVPNWRGALGGVHAGLKEPERLLVHSRRSTRAVDVALVGVVVLCGALLLNDGGRATTTTTPSESASPVTPPMRDDYHVVGEDPGLTGRCRPNLVQARLISQLRAFNRGDARAFAAKFSARGEFQPYLAYPGGGNYIGKNAIQGFVRRQHRLGDAWQAIIFQLPTATSPGHGEFSLRLDVIRGGQTLFENGTKIVIGCKRGLISHWVGPTPPTPQAPG